VGWPCLPGARWLKQNEQVAFGPKQSTCMLSATPGAAQGRSAIRWTDGRPPRAYRRTTFPRYTESHIHTYVARCIYTFESVTGFILRPEQNGDIQVLFQPSLRRIP